MKSQIQRLSPKNEFFIVNFLFFAFPIYNSSKGLYYGATYNQPTIITNYNVAILLLFEVLVLLAVFSILALRGYSKNSLELNMDANSTLYGLWLIMKCYLSVVVFLYLPAALISLFLYDLTHLFKYLPDFIIDLNIFSIVALSVINAIFEEFALIGYLFTAVEKVKSTKLAFAISLGVRLSYHTYQGLGLLGVLICGIVMGKAYMEKRNLWPLILCHAGLDLIGLAGKKMFFGS